MNEVAEASLLGCLDADLNEHEKVSLSSLSELTGFPVDFIKKELLLEEEPVSMSDLRQSVLRYLEAASQSFSSET